MAFLLPAFACTEPRKTLPPFDGGAGGAGGGGGTRSATDAPDAEPNPVGAGGAGGCAGGLESCSLAPTCADATCDGGVEVMPLSPDPAMPTYPTECPGGVKSFWDVGSEVSALDFSPDGAFVASGSRDGSVLVHRIADRSEFARNPKPHRQNVQAVRFSHSGLALASTSDDGTLSLWSVGPQLPRGWVHGSVVYSVAFSSDDVNLAVGAQRGIYVLRTATLASALRLETQLFNRSVAYLPGDLELVVAHGETAGQIAVLKAMDLSLVRSIAQHLEPIPRLAVPQKNATHLIYANGNYLRVNLLATGATFQFDQHTKPIQDLRYSNDGARLVTAAEDAVRVWTAANWQVQQSFGASGAVAFTADGKRLARAEGKRVLIHCLDKE